MTPPASAARGASEATAGALLSRLRERLAAAGADAPALDARLILERALGRRGAHLHAHPEKAVSASALARAEALARRRIAREPMAYIAGEKEFWSMPFLVSPDALIPRPESELLVERARAVLRGKRTPRALDLGAGSGAVGLAIARELPGASVFLLDVCPKALGLAGRNVRRLGLAGRTRLLASDLFGGLAGGRGSARGARFDLIASNPPYVRTGELERLPPEISSFEPRLALDGGADGMRLIRRIIEEAPARLARGGFLLVEMAPDQMAEAVDLSAERGDYSGAARRRDLAGRERVLELQRA